uniref:Uncharacterized protein n=1 Tax=Rhizophora mucronata TaxID=61149 RepID=A0A2P2JXA5_RHIMU
MVVFSLFLFLIILSSRDG